MRPLISVGGANSFPKASDPGGMAERDWTRFLVISGITLLAMGVLAQLIPEFLGLPLGYGIIISAIGLAVILFAWHVWVQTTPGGIILEEYREKPVNDRIVDFLIVAVVSAIVGTIAAVIGIEGGFIESDEMWAGGMSSWIASTIVAILGMALGIYAGLSRNSEIRIPRESGRGE